MRKIITILIALNLCMSHASEMPEGQKNGQVMTNRASTQFAWSMEQNKWLTIEEFWLEHARSDDRKFWGINRVYPPYSEVNETDTLMIRTQHGNCLMEFWHSRWRRANDVRRWDQKFNTYGGCPHVFD